MTPVRSFSRGVGALVGLCLLIVGVPLGLMLVSRAALGTRSPLDGVSPPWRWSLIQIRSALTHHITESTLVDVLVRAGVCVVWLCLALVILTTIAELISQLRHGVTLPTIRGLGWSQRIAAGLVAGLLAFAPISHSVLPSGGSLPVRNTRPAATVAFRHHSATVPAGETGGVGKRSASAAEPGWRSHRVAAGESVWDIGARLAGGASEQTNELVRQILDANLGRQMSDGSVFHDPGYIETGWVLSVPGEAGSNDAGTAPPSADERAQVRPTIASEVPAASPAGEHRVVYGDTLWDILDQHYGRVDADLVWRIAGVNNLDNPSSIPIGTMLSLPPLDSLQGVDAVVAGPAEGSPSAPSIPQPAAGSTTVVVKRGDTLSSIAAQQFGDPREWPAIFNANQGKHFGDRIFSDPNRVLPGWTLTIPDDATAVALPPPAPPVSVTSPPTAPPALVPAADVPAPQATAVPETAPTVPGTAGTTATSSTSRTSGPSDGDAALPRSSDAPLPPPGVPATVLPPPTTAIQVSTDVGVSPPTNFDEPRSATTASLDAPPSAVVQIAGDQQHSERRVPLGPASALVLATGAVGLIEARRRRRLRAAGYATLEPPHPDTAALEARLRHRSNTERLARLDLAVRCCAPRLAATSLTLMGALISTNGQIELLLQGSEDAVAAAAAPFECSDRPRSWCLPALIATEDIAVDNRFATFPCPLLTHVGMCFGDDVFVDIEAFGLMTVIGTAERAANIIHGVMGSLSLSPFAETVTMLSVGMSVYADALPRLNHFATVPEAAQVAAEVIAHLQAVLPEHESMFNLRARSSGETWEPVMISVTGSSSDELQVGECAALASSGRGAAMIVDRPLEPAGCSLTEVADGWLLTPLDITIQPVGLTEDDLVELDELIAIADLEPKPVPVVAVADHEAAFQELQWALMVRLLGPVDVVDRNGLAASMSKSKALELVAWLADHRSTATRSGARSAMWDTEVRDATFANVVSEARRSLGRLVAPPVGMEWIGRTLTEHLPLHPLVVTDAAVLGQRLDYARACADADEAVYVLRPGLDLVRDIPYSGVSYLWSDAEGSMSNLTLLITAAATELAERYLQLQDLEGVFWATGRGLIVLPGHEDLIGLRMQARAGAGDMAGIRTEWDSYERVLNADSWSDGEPSTKMMALRQQLLRPSVPSLLAGNPGQS